jgi:hypothetical protein
VVAIATTNTFCGRIIRGGRDRRKLKNYTKNREPYKTTDTLRISMNNAIVQIAFHKIKSQLTVPKRKKSIIKRSKHTKGNIQQIMQQRHVERYQRKEISAVITHCAVSNNYAVGLLMCRKIMQQSLDMKKSSDIFRLFIQCERELSQNYNFHKEQSLGNR